VVDARVKTPFTVELLKVLNSSEHVGHTLIEYLEKRIGDGALLQYHQFEIKDGILQGKDLYSELLLLGYDCKGIGNNQCAVIGDVGYWYSIIFERIETIPRKENNQEEYEITKLLYGRARPLEIEYMVKVASLL
jgi:hypothetical protein